MRLTLLLIIIAWLHGREVSSFSSSLLPGISAQALSCKSSYQGKKPSFLLLPDLILSAALTTTESDSFFWAWRSRLAQIVGAGGKVARQVREQENPTPGDGFMERRAFIVRRGNAIIHLDVSEAGLPAGGDCGRGAAEEASPVVSARCRAR